MTPKKSLRDLITTERKEITLSDGITKVRLAIRKQTMAEQRAFLVEFPNMTDGTHSDAINAGIKMAVSSIESRDFEEEVTIDNFQLLPIDDVTIITSAINGKDKTDEEKKK